MSLEKNQPKFFWKNLKSLFSETDSSVSLPARLRFAPSPTGFLHIGNLRSALFGYLLAKSLDGKFILRLEDTDQKREVAGALDNLLSILDWVGIKFDEGPHLAGAYGPYIQSQRLSIYKEHLTDLLKRDGAYHCFCSPERLENMRQEQQANQQAPRYDRRCRNLSATEVQRRLEAGEPYVIRQKLPLEGEIIVKDEIRGEIKFQCPDLEDHVLIKSDGMPTYQFANIVDDYLMGITHVTRGDEWLPSFPKNVLLYQAFGWPVPKFFHWPLILNKTGGKLSKRQGDVTTESYRAAGYLPEAIINFCALLGWHGKDEQEIFSLNELTQKFSPAGLGASPAIFDIEKLNYFNGYYLRQKSVAELTELVKPYVNEDLGGPGIDNKYLQKIVALEQNRLQKLSDIKDIAKLFLAPELSFPAELLLWKQLTLVEVKQNLIELYKILDKLTATEWELKNLEAYVGNYLKQNQKRVGDYLWPWRVVLTGLKNSPSPFEVADVLGKLKSQQRLKFALDKI